MLEVEEPGVVVTAVKTADDGEGRIVRLHEAFGGRRVARLRSSGITRAERVDLLERPTEGTTVAVVDGTFELSLRPFELVTLRLR